MTSGRNRGKTEAVHMKDGSVHHRRPRKLKLAKDSKVAKAAQAYVIGRANGMSAPEIAEHLGYTVGTLQSYVQRARALGYFKREDLLEPAEQLQVVIAQKVVDNIATVLEEKQQIVIDKETGETQDTDRLSDRAIDVTMKTAHGIGLLKTHQVTKTDATSAVAVALKVDVQMPPMPTAAAPMVRQGSAGGTPAFDAEIVE